MQVPVTDAFDNTDQLKSLQVELTPKQLEWLEEMADKRGLSVDHLLRSLITAQMREGNGIPSFSSESGDGAPHAASTGVSERPPAAPEAGGSSTDENDDESTSIVESLRSASERLQDLTEEKDPEQSDLSDTLTRLKAHMDSTSSSDDESPGDPETTVLDNQDRSMFDMMEEE